MGWPRPPPPHFLLCGPSRLLSLRGPFALIVLACFSVCIAQHATHVLHSSLNISDQVSQPYKTTGQIIVHIQHTKTQNYHQTQHGRNGHRNSPIRHLRFRDDAHRTVYSKQRIHETRYGHLNCQNTSQRAISVHLRRGYCRCTSPSLRFASLPLPARYSQFLPVHKLAQRLQQWCGGRGEGTDSVWEKQGKKQEFGVREAKEETGIYKVHTFFIQNISSWPAIT